MYQCNQGLDDCKERDMKLDSQLIKLKFKSTDKLAESYNSSRAVNIPGAMKIYSLGYKKRPHPSLTTSLYHFRLDCVMMSKNYKIVFTTAR